VIEIPGYRILRQLGRGGMATVYLGVQKSVDREVALKIMAPALLVDPHFGERFLREARIAARLHHRHVVGIHDVGVAGDNHYIAMEYLAGGPVLNKDGIPRAVPFALRVIREIATALDYAHAKGFVHRDVKPDNILLREDGSAALTDFGIARAADSATRMTRTGAVVGTPHYMSPEQARGRVVDGRSDIYGLGIVLHELLLGQVPYRADDSLAVGIMHVTQPVPILPERLTPLQPLLAGMLAKDPADRFQAGADVAATIAALERRIADGELPDFAPTPHDFSRASRTAAAGVSPPRQDPAAHGRAEPNLGRIDELDFAGPRGYPRPSTTHRTRPARHWPALVAALLVLAGGVAAWTHQDRLRALLPRTELNDTLVRAQRALDEGRISGTRGDSAAELFQAARALDPDNDVARRGLHEVGKRLLAEAHGARTRGDLTTARKALDEARVLLGGGSEVDAEENALRADQARGATLADLLASADAALAAQRIVGTDGAAALYRRILDADADNAVAAAGLRKCADALAANARAALAGADAATATAAIDEIARILPNYPGLPDLRGSLAQAREAEGNRTLALLDRAEARLRAGHAVDGDDSARALFQTALVRDPGNARARAGLADVARRLIAEARRAIEDDDGPRADRLLAQAAQIAPDLPDLRTARSGLRDLRERLDRAARPPVVTAANAGRVRTLVAAGDQALAAGKLIVPPGDCAYDKYREALSIDGNDAGALAGLARLPARAKQLFEQAMTEKTPFRARTLLDALRQFAPDDAAIPVLSQRLASSFLDQAESHVQGGRRQEASRELEAARSLAPYDPRISAIDARLHAARPDG
jgi:hypothetical protein